MKRCLLFILALALAFPAFSEITVQKFPAVPGDYSKAVDPANPLNTIFKGAYRVPLTVGKDERSVLVYLADGYAQTQGFVMIVPAAGTSAVDCLENGGWKAVADANQLYLMVLEPDSKRYDLSYDGRDFAYISAAVKLADTRNYWRQPEGRNYIVGYGDGGALALECAEATLPDVWAGAATFGDIELKASELKNKGVELPVWMFMSQLDREKDLVELFKKNNGSKGEAFSNQYADAIFFPNQQVNDLLLNDQPMSQVRYTLTGDAEAMLPARAAIAYDFLALGTREVGYGDKAMRYTHSLKDWGATTHKIQIDGITRSWVEYVPTRLRNTDAKGAPLLVALHGSALSGLYLAERTSFIKLAEENGFILVIPDGSIGKGIAPVWNWLGDKAQWDDVAFLKAMVAEVSGRLPVDPARKYLYGHSLGGMFMQTLLSSMNGTFAASAGTGCAFAMIPEVEVKQKVPVFILFGEKDLGNPSIVTGEGPRRVISLLTKYNECGTIDSLAGSYRVGRYQLYVWKDKAGVPMVQYGIVDDKPHTVTLDEGMVLYNWLSQFKRNADGSVGYQAGIWSAK
jgi:poly(3-hydroxybutyrate) depolymerase